MISGNPEKDFLMQNPLLKFKDFFNEIYENEKDATRICWSLFYIEHPTSPLYNVPKEKRIEEVKRLYFEELPETNKFRKDFLRATMNKEYILYKIAYDKLEALTYDLETKDLAVEAEWKQTVTLMEKLSKLWDSMETLKSKYEDSVAKTNMKGGGKLSAREKRNAG